MKESDFQKQVIDDIKRRIPGAIVLKNDSSYIQGIPDLSVFYKDRYAMLEVKKSENASKQPNQTYYVEHFANQGAFASFIYPENKEDILTKLVQYLTYHKALYVCGGAHVSV